MHSTVYELSDHPIPTKQRISPGRLPDWFFASVADYATRMSETERANRISALAEHLGGMCMRSGDALRFSSSLKQNYFRESHQYFKAAAEALSETDYDVFAGLAPTKAFHLALSSIAESYTDRHSFYIYNAGKLAPLDDWLRSADLSVPFYVGGTINYHFQGGLSKWQQMWKR